MKKNDRIELTITDISVNGEGIGHYEDFTFFVKDALPKDRVQAVITKLKKGYGYAKMLQILTPSPDRVASPCPAASRCGGCQIMQLSYDAQLKIKEEKVRSNLRRIGGFADVNLQPIIGMQDALPLHFRNKMQFPAGRSKDGRIVTGFYAGRTHYIVETEDCPVAAAQTGVLLEGIRRFLQQHHISVYDEESGKGLVRHILIRNSFRTGQTMVCLVINGEDLGGKEEAFVKMLLDTDLSVYQSRISGICLNINQQRTNVILGEKIRVLYGTAYLEDQIDDLTFRISPQAFFQVNSIQTEKLYAKVLQYAGLTGSETVWDLYCGTGTISLFLARKAGRVYGVEIVPQAIENARENAALNHIKNAQFYCGASEEIFPRMSDDGISADVVVLDPPRKGCDPALLSAILQVGPQRIVYVSCDSATLARDLRILGDAYQIEEAVPVDMFPHTMHVETVCLLSNRKPDSYVHLNLKMEDYYRIKDAQKDQEKK